MPAPDFSGGDVWFAEGMAEDQQIQEAAAKQGEWMEKHWEGCVVMLAWGISDFEPAPPPITEQFIRATTPSKLEVDTAAVIGFLRDIGWITKEGFLTSRFSQYVRFAPPERGVEDSG